MTNKDDKINSILRESDEDLESANYHNWVGVSRELYDAIKGYVSPVYQVDLAKAIAKTIDVRI